MTLQQRYEQVFENCVESLKTWKDLIQEYVDEDETTSEVDKLKEVTKGYCDIDRDFKKKLSALQEAEHQLNETEENGRDVQALYEEFLQNEDDTTDDYTESDLWQKVFKGIDDVMEVKRKKKKLNDNQYEELEDSMFCSNVFTPPIDPISKAIIREPVRNKKCKHVYERAMIVDYIKQQKRKAKCPYIGCDRKQLLMSDITEDIQLQSQITQYLENQTEEASDEEEY